MCQQRSYNIYIRHEILSIMVFFPVKIHPVERKLHQIMMKLDHKHSKH